MLKIANHGFARVNAGTRIVRVSAIQRTAMKRRTGASGCFCVKPAPEAFEWALFCFLVGSEGSGITFRRKDAIDIGGFDESLTWHEDANS